MEERRKHRRLPINLELEVNKLFKQDNEIITGLDQEIEVTNISKTGIGFHSEFDSQLNYYFNANIRKEEHEKGYIFGCEFVGLAEFLSTKVDEYEQLLNEKEPEE